VIPVLLTVLGAIVAMARLYGAKLEAIQHVREALWSDAASGCSTNTVASGALGAPLDDVAALGHPVLAPEHTRAHASGAGDLLSPLRTAQASVHVAVPAEALGGILDRRGVVSRRLVCNEVPRRGDASGVLRWGWREARSW
jgi:hypothetical protein